MSDNRSEKSDGSEKSYSDDDYSETGSGSEDDYDSGADDKGHLIADVEEDKESEKGKASEAVAIGADDTDAIPSSSKAVEAGAADPMLTGEPAQPVVIVQPLETQPPVVEEVPKKPKSLVC